MTSIVEPYPSPNATGPRNRIAWLRVGMAFALCGLASLMHGASGASAAVKPVKPNVVFILLDNCGQEWWGAYGSEEGCTPNLDRLAREGVRFEHCYTPPVCGPSRIVMLTGRYPFRTGFTLHHDAALYSGGGLDPSRERIWPRLLREAGYATGIVGKWQINNLYDEPESLRQHGFAEHLVWPGSVDVDLVKSADLAAFRSAVEANSYERTGPYISHIESRYWNPVLLRNGRREKVMGRFGPDVMQEAAMEFLKRHRDHPFALYYPMVLTHGQTFGFPVVPTPLNLETNRAQQEMYADMVRYADRLVGQFFRELDRLGLREQTIVFVATDNGTEKSMTARRHGRQVRGGLYQLTETGSDVALIVNCPTRIPGGRTIPLADFSDILPTLCDLTGVKLPGDLVIDGRSHAAQLRNEPGVKPAREWIFNQYHTTRTIRDSRFKLYSTGQFYEVAEDGLEERDLATSADPDHVAARKRLAAVLQTLPADAPPPFTLRSQSAFQLRSVSKTN